MGANDLLSKLAKPPRIAVPEEDVLAWQRRLLDIMRDEVLPDAIFETIDGLQTELWRTYQHSRRVQ